MPNFKTRRIHSLRFVSLALLCASTLAYAQSGPGNLPPQAGGLGIMTAPGLVLTPGEQRSLVAALLANPAVSQQTKGHKIRALRVTHGFIPAAADAAKAEEYRATIVLFDYTTGLATRYSLDPETGELLNQERVRGRPQPSEEEIEIATRIARQDPAFTEFSSTSAQLTGGFVVDGPPGKPASHRYIQMRLLSADLTRTVRVIIVDLTNETIAASS